MKFCKGQHSFEFGSNVITRWLDKVGIYCQSVHN